MQSHGWEGAINADMVATFVFDEKEGATGRYGGATPLGWQVAARLCAGSRTSPHSSE